MNNFLRMIIIFVIGVMIFLPAFLTKKGFGISTERNEEIIKQSNYCCAENEKDSEGNCSKSFRSKCYGRTFLGGGGGEGK